MNTSRNSQRMGAERLAKRRPRCRAGLWEGVPEVLTAVGVEWPNEGRLEAGRAIDAVVRRLRLELFKSNCDPEAEGKRLGLAVDLLKPVVDWAGVQESRKVRELAEKKYRDVVAEKRAPKKPKGRGGVSPENLRRAEEALNLFGNR